MTFNYSLILFQHTVLNGFLKSGQENAVPVQQKKASSASTFSIFQDEPKQSSNARVPLLHEPMCEQVLTLDTLLEAQSKISGSNVWELC